MKHSLQLFLTISFFIAASTSIAMELNTTDSKEEHPLEISFQKTTIISNITPCMSALYLTDNTILVTGGKHCSIVNPSTNKEIKKISDNNGWSSCIAVDLNKIKFALTTYQFPPHSTDKKDLIQKITIYNTKTYEVEHSIDWNYATVDSICFSPLDDTLALCEKGGTDVIIYNYKKDECTSINVPEAINEYPTRYCNKPTNNNPIVFFHPTQQLINLAWKNVYIYDPTTSIQQGTIKGSTNNPYKETRTLDFCEYSPDGSFIVTGESTNTHFINDDHNPRFTIPNTKNVGNCYTGMAIYPYNKIALVLTGPGNPTLQYWDINTSKIIAYTSLGENNYNHSWYDPKPCISFSPSGAKVLIIGQNQYLECKVPSKVLYKDIKEKTLLLLFALKHYTHNSTTIPNDIIQLIIKTVYGTYEKILTKK